MADATRWHPGMFVWRELMTDDMDRARPFYGELLGWTWKAEDTGTGHAYWLASHGGRQLCGMMPIPAGVAMPPAWSSYVLVDDVDAAAERCAAAGGRVLRPPGDIPGVGRFAVLADRWGAVLQAFRATGGESEPPPMPPPAGSFCWETLVTPDPAGAIAFYGTVIGFGTGKTPNGEGTVFTAGDAMVADVQPARPGGPPYWATYVAVENAEATRDRAARLGGKIVVPRVDVPKVGIVCVVADPSGATLGLFQPEPRRG
jgi:predicted enzyme related to lactoylglutathione lyase